MGIRRDLINRVLTQIQSQPLCVRVGSWEAAGRSGGRAQCSILAPPQSSSVTLGKCPHWAEPFFPLWPNEMTTPPLLVGSKAYTTRWLSAPCTCRAQRAASASLSFPHDSCFLFTFAVRELWPSSFLREEAKVKRLGQGCRGEVCLTPYPGSFRCARPALEALRQGACVGSQEASADLWRSFQRLAHCSSIAGEICSADMCPATSSSRPSAVFYNSFFFFCQWNRL